MVTFQDREQAAVGSHSGIGAESSFIQHLQQWFGKGSQKWNSSGQSNAGPMIRNSRGI